MLLFSDRLLAYSVIHPDSVVLDVGANIGLWTRSLSQQVPSGRVFAFEPSARTFNILRDNTQGYPNIEIVNFALSDTDGRMGLSGGPSVFRHLSSVQNIGEEIVEVTTLDRWAETNCLRRLDFMKVDVEGAEAKIFLGGRQTLNRFRPTILFEQAPENASHFSEAGLDKCIAILSALGYSLSRLMQDGSLSERLEYGQHTTSTIWAVATKHASGLTHSL